jgi:hypothetical protein
LQIKGRVSDVAETDGGHSAKVGFANSKIANLEIEQKLQVI